MDKDGRTTDAGAWVYFNLTYMYALPLAQVSQLS